MTNRIASILLLLFVSLNLFAQSPKSGDRPNIIFILTDDQRWDALGYAGNPLVTTPEMDKLAKEGVYFENGLVTTPICAASRASIFSGLYERTHAYNFQTGAMKEEYMQLAYPRLLKNSGYTTAFYGKFGVNYDDKDGLFDVYESYDRANQYKDKRGYFYKMLGADTVHLSRYTGQKALDFIDQAGSDKPFCLSLSFSAPHAHDGAPDQYFWQETTDGLLQDVQIPKANISDDKYFEALPKPVRDGFNRLRWGWRYDTPEKYQHSVKGYYRMISGIDLEIAKIRKQLKANGLDKNTVIILMGDNGHFLGERQLAGKWLMYDNSIRVPLIVFDPRENKHQDISDMALNIDVPATILDLAGVDRPKSWQGKSLMPIVSGQTKSLNRDTVLVEHLWNFEHIPPSEGVRTNKWKYMRYVNDKFAEELYNLEKDPREIKNLAQSKKYKDVLKQLRDKCDAMIEEKSDASTAAPTALTIEYIRNPSVVKVKDLSPEFGWNVPQAAVSQSAYQILVSSSLDNAKNNKGDVWNSGSVRCSNSSNVSFAGSKLSPNKKYYWKVRIWDENNRLSRYSTPQSFQTGTPDDELTTANYYQIERIKPTKVVEKSKGVYFVDFGKAAFANLEFNYNAPASDTLIVRLGEDLNDGQINRTPIGTIRYKELKVAVTPDQTSYKLNITSDKRNTLPGIAIALPDSFPVLLPFRYCEIENAKSRISKGDMTQVAYFNYFDYTTSSFISSDTTLNQVWDMCKYSIKATTFSGLYVDGDRERIPYEADAYLNQLSHYTTDREYAIGRRTIEYFMEHPTWPTEWQQHVALMFYADYMYTGNTELIERHYENLKHKTLIELSNEEGLITSEKVNHEFMLKLGFKEGYKKPLTDIVDWPSAGWGGDPNNKGERDGFVFKPYSTVINSFYYQNMKIMAEFAQILGKTQEVLDFELRAAKAKKAVNEQMFDKERGIYVDGIGTDHASLHANMMPLAFGIVPEEYFESVVEHVKSRGMACSVYGSQFLMDGLYNAGEADYALELLASTAKRSWYNMIREGSTISMEAWDNIYKNNQDWNHAWGAVPANAIPRGLWGIKPKMPGFSVASIRPQLSTLKNSSVKVPTILGEINAQYVRVNGRLKKYTIELPANMIADFQLKTSSDDVVTLNDDKVNMAFGSIRLVPGVNEISIKVNSF